LLSDKHNYLSNQTCTANSTTSPQ